MLLLGVVPLAQQYSQLPMGLQLVGARQTRRLSSSRGVLEPAGRARACRAKGRVARMILRDTIFALMKRKVMMLVCFICVWMFCV